MKKIVMVLLVVVTFSCIHDNEAEKNKVDSDETNKVNSLFDSLNYVHSSEYYECIIIPMDGCDACIERTLDFAKVNAGNDMQVVLTSYSLKKIYQLCELSLIEKNQFLIDSKGIALQLGLVESFPAVYYMKDNKVISSTEINGINIEEILIPK